MEKELNFLFVCMGNTCRSPMAAAYCNHAYCKGKILIHAKSAGLFTSGDGINPNAAAALCALGIKESDGNRYLAHRSRTVSPDIISEADTVICMDERIAAFLRIEFPESSDKIISFPFPIPDPYGSDTSVYTECLGYMIKQIDGLIEKLI